MPKRLWITWEVQRRNRTMSKMLGASLHELILDVPAWRRYPVLIVRTIGLICRTKPEIIFSQNPSLVLAGLSVLMGKLLGCPVIIDAHNAGLYPLEGRYTLLTKLATFINRHASMVIVSNDQLKQSVEISGGTAFSIPDPIPEIPCYKKAELPEDKFNIVFVCSWSDDEPYEEVLRAAIAVDHPVRIYLTGNSRGRHLKYSAELTENTVLTGFLSNEDYDALICNCDAMMVLTKREDCLVCGAYEGVAVEKPLILSATNSLRSYFNKGCVYTNNTQHGIMLAIDKVISEKAMLLQDIKELKTNLELDMENTMREFEQRLHRI